MPSHTYTLQPREVIRFLAGPLLVLAGVALLLHLSAAIGLLPRPRPTLDVDRTILIHQTEASRSTNDAEVLLLGDSSCLMDVDASVLGRHLGRPTLNLGTLSYLDLDAASLFLRAQIAANPGRARTVVVLLHPESLRRVGPHPGVVNLLDGLWTGRDVETDDGIAVMLAQGLGLQPLKGRVLSRLLPTPLPGAYGQRYGFSTDLERYLREHRGSALDPEEVATPGAPGDSRKFSGSAEYRLAAQQESPSRNFGAAVPDGAQLFAGVTPIPAGFAGPHYAEVHRRMLERWSGWLGAKAALWTLPATLPDAHFTSVAHLNREGVDVFTERLAEALRSCSPGNFPLEPGAGRGSRRDGAAD